MPKTRSSSQRTGAAPATPFATGAARPESRRATRGISAKNMVRRGTLWRFRRIYYQVMLAALLINIFALATPVFVMSVYDRVVPNNAIETMWVLAAGVAPVRSRWNLIGACCETGCVA